MPLPLSSAYLLISHGSRDPRPQQAIAKLAQMIRTKLVTPGATCISTLKLSDRARTTLPAMVVKSSWYPLVGMATLELAEIPLHEQIRQFASMALVQGYNQLQLLPLFLLPGVHVMEDIPAEAALAKTNLGETILLNQRPYLGSHLGLARMLARQIATVDADAKILISHGTRRPAGNESVQAVADHLGAIVAYWSIAPTLEEQINVLVSAGHKRIAILPYFLFSGGITDVIGQLVARLENQFSQLDLILCNPIGDSSELTDLIIDLIENK